MELPAAHAPLTNDRLQGGMVGILYLGLAVGESDSFLFSEPQAKTSSRTLKARVRDRGLEVAAVKLATEEAIPGIS